MHAGTAVIVATGGKGYYLAGMVPLFAAAGAEPSLAWLQRRRYPRALVAGALALTLPAILIALPLLPQRALASSGVVGVNYDLGEQVAWPSYVDEIAAAYRGNHADAILTSNYGEAGAVDHYGPQRGLPHAHSRQTGYWDWGPPPARAARVLAVGFDANVLSTIFARVRPVGRLDNHLGLADDEQHAPLWICTGLRANWQVLWPRLKHT